MIQFFTDRDIEWELERGPYTIINGKRYNGKWVKKAPDRFVVESLDSPGYYLHTNGKFYPKTPPSTNLSDVVVAAMISASADIVLNCGSRAEFKEVFEQMYDMVARKINK